jgi:hypothetical protein
MYRQFALSALLITLTSTTVWRGPDIGGSVQKVDESRLALATVSQLPKKDLKAFLELVPWKGANNEVHPWQGTHLTNPRAHSPQNFRYVVTGLRAVPATAELFANRPFASASLISNEAVHTYSRFGFILDVALENVIATFPTDGQTNRLDPWAYRVSQGVLSPNALINRTGWWYMHTGKLLYTSIYNEVLLDLGFTGSKAAHAVQVTGLYLIESPAQGDEAVSMGWEGPALSREDVRKIEALAISSGLPLIRIQKHFKPVFLNRDGEP